MNEHRHQLHAHDNKFQRSEKMESNQNPPQQNFDDNRNSTTNNPAAKYNMVNPKKRTRRKLQRKRVRLRQSDEIHVAPCQCALSLVGMRGKLIDQNKCTTDGSESLFHNLFLPHKQDKGQQLGRGEREEESTKDQQTMKASSSKSSLKTIKLSRMVRTSSAHVQENNNLVSTSRISGNNTSKQSRRFGDKSEQILKNKRPSHLDVQHRSESAGTFDALGYHEITLIRNRSANPNSSTRHFFSRRNSQKGDNNNEYTDFLDWDAVTIRCRSHDELDLLVKALKDSSKAKVIPFSSNPKEKLRERMKHEMNRNRTRLLSDPTSRYLNLGDSLYCQSAPQESTPNHKAKTPVQAISEDRPMFLNRSESKDHQTYHKNVEKGPNSQTSHKDNAISRADKPTDNKWDFHFNKKEYCESCDLVFTLLTRRHHCRQCQRSICGNCSCMLLIKGGDEKRFCNSCGAETLRRQSEALRGRLKNRELQSDKLPGKVHNACHKLGVGIVGKLPHWRYFLTTKVNQRPAVGRITIELLEALALPSVNMLNGTVDPYVRATVTGYDRDMLWTLREWIPEKRYQLCGGYVTSTLCPRWRGPGRKGGVLLTLPIISTAGAVLRLEVLDHNILRNQRGKDIVLGVVEIPLSDLPNANLRQPGGFKVDSNRTKKNILYDGYCDRWYRLLSNDEVKSNSVFLSKPIPSPHTEGGVKKEKKTGAGLKSLEEIGKKVQGLCIQPIEWFASAIKLDLPARPEAFYEEHRKRSMIHVRIKLNASVAGDVLSHSWFPPVVKYPPVPPFDPQILFSRILLVSKELAPFLEMQQYLEKAIKWELEPKQCARTYLVFAIHLTLLPYLVKIVHIYLFVFLQIRLNEMKAEASENESSYGHIPRVDSDSVDMLIERKEKDASFQNSPSLNELAKSTGKAQTSDTPPDGQPIESDKDDAARLNIAVNWIAKKWLDNKGLEIFQHNIGNLGRDLKNLNSVWNGSNPLLTKAAMVYLVISFVLHFLINPRLLWLLGTLMWYFGRSPVSIILARMFFGFWRGFAKGLRRQHLLDAEMLEEF